MFGIIREIFYTMQHKYYFDKLITIKWLTILFDIPRNFLKWRTGWRSDTFFNIKLTEIYNIAQYITQYITKYITY